MILICWDIDANKPADCKEHEECVDALERRIAQKEDDRAYLAAKCNELHEDDSTCRPSWDGFVYVCLYRIAKEVGRE